MTATNTLKPLEKSRRLIGYSRPGNGHEQGKQTEMCPSRVSTSPRGDWRVELQPVVWLWGDNKMSQGKVLAISAIVILGACGGTTGSPPDSGTPDSGTPDVGDAGIVTRTVSSTLQTIYLLDDGTSVTRPGWNATLAFPDATVAALVYADATEASGYKVVPVTVGADSSFSVVGVPEGPYFLELDSSFGTNDQNGVGVVLKERALIEMTTSTPDLSVVVAARPEATFAMQPTPVQFQLSG